MAGQMVEKGTIFVTTIILARNFSISDYAAYSYFVLTTAMLAAYSVLGLGATASRYFSNFDSNDEKQMERVVPLLFISALLSIAASIVTFILPSEIVMGSFELPTWVIPLGVFFYSFSVVPVNALAAMEKFGELFLISVIESLFLIFLVILAIKNENLLFALWGIIGAAMVRTLLSLILLGNFLGFISIMRNIKLNHEKLLAIFSFSFPMFLISLLTACTAWVVGRIIAGGEGGEKAFALFTIGLQWFSITMFIPGIVSRVTFPRIVRSFENPKSKYDLRNTLIVARALSAGPLLFFCLVMLFIAPQITEIYGEKYHLDASLLLAFILAAVFSAMAQVGGNLIIISFRQWTWLKLHSFQFVILFFTSYTLRDFGAYAGALAYLSGTFVLFVGSLFVMKTKR